MPKALIYCPSMATELSQLLPNIPTSLLPVGNKPLLAFVLDFLHLAGIREIQLLISSHLPEIRSFFKQGELWSVQLSYHLIQPEQTWREYLQALPADEWLVLDGLPFIHSDWGKSPLNLGLPNSEQIFCLGASAEERTRILLLHSAALKTGSPAVIPHPQIALRTQALEQVKAYFDLNQAMFGPEQKYYSLPGYSNEAGVHLGINVALAPGAEIQKPVMIGNNCKVENRVQLEGQVILGNNVIVDRGTKIKEALILPNTYVGSELNICHKIVSRHRLIDPETGLYLDISDDFILSRVSLSPFYLFGKRLLGFFLILPLLCLQAPWYFLLARWVPHRQQNYYLSQSLKTLSFVCYERREEASLAERIFFSLSLDKWPFLWGALVGQLYFSGNRLLLASERSQDWLAELESYTPGVFCYSEMLVSRAEQWQIDEEYYNHHQSLSLDLRIFVYTLIQNLF